jgi:hypothetical protein
MMPAIDMNDAADIQSAAVAMPLNGSPMHAAAGDVEFLGRLGARRQKAGVRITSRVKISSRPRSIAQVHTQVWKSLSTA